MLKRQEKPPELEKIRKQLHGQEQEKLEMSELNNQLKMRLEQKERNQKEVERKHHKEIKGYKMELSQ
jgi:hypothetical protein